jgi:hypothetical protein
MQMYEYFLKYQKSYIFLQNNVFKLIIYLVNF